MGRPNADTPNPDIGRDLLPGCSKRDTPNPCIRRDLLPGCPKGDTQNSDIGCSFPHASQLTFSIPSELSRLAYAASLVTTNKEARGKEAIKPIADRACQEKQLDTQVVIRNEAS